MKLLDLTTFADLDELIAAGWGDVPQDKIPVDWRRQNPEHYTVTSAIHGGAPARKVQRRRSGRTGVLLRGPDKRQRNRRAESWRDRRAVYLLETGGPR